MTNQTLGVVNSEWTTHQPLIQAVMKFYKPNFILELGMGNFSTPLFRQKNVQYLGVENDEKWIEHLKNNIGPMDTIFHDLGPNIKLGTRLYEISEDDKASITKFYHNLTFPNLKPNVLFVDQYTSCRTLSINVLGNKFDIIMYHDCQPDGIPWYNYDLINLEGFQTFTLKSDISWTRLMVKNYHNDFAGVIEPFIQAYKRNNPDIRTMKFINQ
jgi:hypothetical protein